MRTQENSGRWPTRNYYRMISFKAGKDLDERLLEAASRQNLTISEVIRKTLLSVLAPSERTEN
ncbi:MAG: hypothetical protein ACLQPD_35710 [Desulfomonilaceae bacterium]